MDADDFSDRSLSTADQAMRWDKASKDACARTSKLAHPTRALTRVHDKGGDVAAPEPAQLHLALNGRVPFAGEGIEAVELVLGHPLGNNAFSAFSKVNLRGAPRR